MVDLVLKLFQSAFTNFLRINFFIIIVILFIFIIIFIKSTFFLSTFIVLNFFNGRGLNFRILFLIIFLLDSKYFKNQFDSKSKNYTRNDQIEFIKKAISLFRVLTIDNVIHCQRIWKHFANRECQKDATNDTVKVDLWCEFERFLNYICISVI